MKKIIILLGFILLMYILNIDEYNKSEDTIRFRVISNSNSKEDIIMKEKVVKELSDTLFINANSINEVENNIYNNLENIDEKIKYLFKKNNYQKKYNISYGLNEFPKKVFMNKNYEEGLYESLVIEIGDAKGDNYFCILYPSLCMIDYKNMNNNTNYKSKIKELFDSLF